MSWPPHALVLQTPDLVLRGMTEADAVALDGLRPADVETDPRLPELGHPTLQTYARALGAWTTGAWELPFVVLRDDEPIGAQALEGKDFPSLRTVDSWSWLVPGARGKGLGRQMRAAVLELAFGHLGAVRAVSSALTDNVASLAVSRSLGYRDNGFEPLLRAGGSVGVLQRLLLDAADWRSPVPVRIDGVGPCLALFGIEAGPGAG